MKIGIVCAMKSEKEQIFARLGEKKEKRVGAFSFFEGKLGKSQVVVSQSGIAKVNASINALEMIKAFSPDCLISTGVAGGLDACLNTMDIVVSDKIVHHDVWCGMGNEYGQVQGLPAIFKADENLLKVAMDIKPANNDGAKLYKGLICTGEQFISEPEQLQVIKKHFPEGLACDMESAALAQVCYLYKVPFISFRIISDVLGRQTDNAKQYQNFWRTVADKAFENTWLYLQTLAEQN